MSNHSPRSVDVLIAGYGPVGATLAALLGKAGVSVLVVEPNKEVYPLPRAAHIDHEIMRLFQSLDLAQEIAPHVRPAPNYEWQSASGIPFMRFEREGVTGISGWPTSFNVYQPGIENALRQAIDRMPNVEVRLGSKFENIERNDDVVVARISEAGDSSYVQARFLVGCDGAWSPVRENLGVTLDDYAFDEPWLVLDARVPDESGFPKANLQICDPERPTTFAHMGPGRLRWEFMLKPDEDPKGMQEPEGLAKLLEPWSKHGAIEIERNAVYRFHGLVAKRWRVGRAFIAGDAAHQMPPFLGQGMCSGLRDAANLAWKLERALCSDSSEKLLDSYQQERDPHVRFITEKAIQVGRLVCTLDAQRAAERDKQMLAAPQIGKPYQAPPYSQGWLLDGSAGAGEMFPQPVSHADQSLYLDDLLDRRAWLFAREHEPLSTRADEIIRYVHLGSQLPPSLGRPIEEWLDRRGANAVLVRPDRYVFGTGDTQTLVDAYQEMSK